MRHGAYGRPICDDSGCWSSLRLAGSQQLPAAHLQNCFCARGQNNIHNIPQSPISLPLSELRASLLGQVLKYTVSYLGSPDQTPSDAAWRREFCHRQICFTDACTGTNTSILIYWNDDIPDRKRTTHIVTGSPIAALRALEAWHGVCDYTKHKTLGKVPLS
jgi:hypothetical protein